MSTLEAILLRLLASFVPGLCTFFRFAFVKRQIHSELHNRFDALYFTWGLPLVLVLWMTMVGLLRLHGIPILLSLLVHLLLTLFAYTLLMWVLTPLLRRKISAGGCAALWGLQSVAIYYCMMLSVVKNYLDVALLPLIKLRLSANALRIGLGIWFLGFLLVLGWKIWSHLRFRRGLLRNAAPFSPREEGLFSEAQAQLYVKTAFAERRLKLQFYRSPAADTPLSIGLFRKTTCFVLPQREYSDQELRLIFRHEIIHLLHEDNRLKFTLTVLCAAGWFVPGLWAGIGKAAEEVELTCDELATGGLSPEDRQNYASLLLDAVSPAEGFTTCLSAAASGLKYRLGRVLHPQRMASGRLAAVLLTLILVFMFGSVGFSIRVGTIGSRVLSGDGGDWHVTEVTSSSDQPCRDLQAVEDYLSNLEIEKPLWEEPLVVNGGDVILTLKYALRGFGLSEAELTAAEHRLSFLKQAITRSREKTHKGEKPSLRIMSDNDFKKTSIDDLRKDALGGFDLKQTNTFSTVDEAVYNLPNFAAAQTKAYKDLKNATAVGMDNRAEPAVAGKERVKGAALQTLLTFPMAYVGWYIRRKDWLSLLILAPILLALTSYSVNAFVYASRHFPYLIVTALFCLAQVLIYLYRFTENRWQKLIGFFVPLLVVVVAFLIRPGVELTATTFLPDNPVVTENAVVEMVENEIAQVSVESTGPDSMVLVQTNDYGTTSFVIRDGEQEYRYSLEIYEDDGGHNQIRITPERGQ